MMQPNDPPPKVLIVDEYRDAALTMAVLLRALGAFADTAFNHSDALLLADAFEPDLVMLDLGLSRRGIETHRQLRAMPRLCGARIVATTGVPDQGWV